MLKHYCHNVVVTVEVMLSSYISTYCVKWNTHPLIAGETSLIELWTAISEVSFFGLIMCENYKKIKMLSVNSLLFVVYQFNKLKQLYRCKYVHLTTNWLTQLCTFPCISYQNTINSKQFLQMIMYIYHTLCHNADIVVTLLTFPYLDRYIINEVILLFHNIVYGLLSYMVYVLGSSEELDTPVGFLPTITMNKNII